MLQIVGENFSGSPYTTQLVLSNSGGVLRMDRAAFPMVSGGDQLFAQVTFKAISTGSAQLGFTSSSIVTSGVDDSNILTNKSGTTYNISAPSTPSTTPGPGGAPTTTPTNAVPKGSSSNPSTSTKNQIPKGASTSAKNSPSQNSTISPGAAEDSQDIGQQSTTTTSLIQISVLDPNNKPVAGADVTIGSQTAKSNKYGIVRFSNISAGKKDLVVKYNGKKTTKSIEIVGVASTSPEYFKVSVKNDKYNAIALSVPIIILVFASVYFIHPWHPKFAKARKKPCQLYLLTNPHLHYHHQLT